MNGEIVSTNKKGKGSLIVILLLILIVLGLISYIVYDKVILKEEIKTENKDNISEIEKNECPSIEECKSSYNYVTGKYLAATYTENEFNLYGINIDWEDFSNDESTIAFGNKKIEDTKIKSIKIMSSPLASDATEAAYIILENGNVYFALFGERGAVNPLDYHEFSILKEYEVSDIISFNDSSDGMKIEFVLKDGSKKMYSSYGEGEPTVTDIN